MNGERAVNLDFQPLAQLLAAAWIMQCQQERDLHQPREDPAADLYSSANGGDLQVTFAVSVAQSAEVTALAEYRTDTAAFRPAGSPDRLTLRDVITAAQPLLVLLMIVSFLLTAVWHHAPAPASEARRLLQVIQPTVRANSISSGGTTRSEPVVVARTESTGKRFVDPAFPSAHMQVTDPATASVLHDLSRYEIRVLRHRAEYGDDAAAFTLGMAYETGRMIPQNCAKAARWVAMSAKAGNATAGYNLGLRYKYGDGVPANQDEAAKWLRMAGARGYPKATHSRPQQR